MSKPTLFKTRTFSRNMFGTALTSHLFLEKLEMFNPVPLAKSHLTKDWDEEGSDYVLTLSISVPFFFKHLRW